MLEAARRTMCSIVKQAEELDDVVHVLFNKVSHSIIRDALLVQKKPDFCTSGGFALWRKFAVGQSLFYVLVPRKPLKNFRQKLSGARAEMARSIRVVRA